MVKNKTPKIANLVKANSKRITEKAKKASGPKTLAQRMASGDGYNMKTGKWVPNAYPTLESKIGKALKNKKTTKKATRAGKK